ncbi:MAG: M28 family peptidase [Alphaproteobacteria bacterium]|nr:M28 family peptidase [Alphaproteobacteria bacterium]
MRALAIGAALFLGSCATGMHDSGPLQFPGHVETQAAITPDDFKSRVKALADDAFEGRGPGTIRGEAAADWIAAEMQRIGLEPANNGSYFQTVPAVAITLDPQASSFEIDGPNGARTPKFAEEVAYWTPRFDKTEQRVENSDLVFVGYGVDAPEYKWNDYAGIDVKGKTVVILINDPGFVTHDDSLFKGKAMTYYGRWTFKYEEAARRGAAAVIIVHDTVPAAYGWQVVRNSNTGRKLYLDNPNGNTDQVTVQSWVTLDVAKALFADAGMDFEQMMLAANKRGFKSVPMKGLKLNVVTHSSLDHLTTRNVIGVVRGRVKPDEYVLYTAHWDHLGVKPDVPGPDKIHNGAIDNATGVSAILEIGEAFAKAPRPPRRSVMIASVTLEEQGLLGSEYFAEHPLVPLNHIVGGANIDGVRPMGRAKDMSVTGSGGSQMEEILAAVLKTQGRYASPDPEPEKGGYYRSDHISLAKVGVPMLRASAGIDLREGGKAAGMAVRDEYRTKHYHQPSDEYDPNWNMANPMEEITALYEVGDRLANSRAWPNWYKGNEFRAIRDRSMRSRH